MINSLKVEQMKSSSGRDIANQFIIYTTTGAYFQSYQSLIAFRPTEYVEKVILDINKWDYSVTTGKYRNMFLGEKKSETEKKIKDGVYLLKDLNIKSE